MTYLVVGLGNPGKQYENTRHNVGFMFLDSLAEEFHGSFVFQSKFNAFYTKISWHGLELILAKPQTFMNLSGHSVQQILSYFKLSEVKLIVIFDDLDQTPGAVKMRLGGGHGGHNGMRSILEHTQSDKFCRIKVGIGKPAHKGATANWVLHKFSSEEMSALNDESFAVVKERLWDYLKSKP
jgi:PTH1 family peptidyl-tRNA hydrolase